MKKIGILVKKELLDILRDKKTLIIMMVVPVLLYPAIIIGMVLIMSMFAGAQEGERHLIGYLPEDESYVTNLKDIYEKNKEEIDLELNFISDQEGDSEFYDVWLEFSEKEEGIQLAVEYTSTEQKSNSAENALQDLADIYQNELLAENLKAEGLDESFLHPLTYEANDSVTVSESVGMNMGGYMGMLLITTILLGSFYPAIDATTGEKERGTLETLLTLPVTNFQMIMSKYIAVSIFACVTAVLSLLSLGASILFLVNSVAASADFVGFDMAKLMSWMPILLLVMIVIALLITAICMCFCIFAKSFKEANNYITPVMLIIMFASMIAMVPSLKLDYYTSLIPIVNVSLLMKEVTAQHMDLALAGITIGINLCYSVLIIWLLAKMYDSENILFNDGFQSFQIFQKRSEIKKGTVPKTGDLFLGVVILFLLIMYLGTAASVKNVLFGSAVNQLLILAVPLVIVWYMKSDMKTLFSLKLPQVKSCIGGFFLYIGTYCLIMVLSFILIALFPESTENVTITFEELLQQPFVLVLFVISVMPAIGEELFFRGFLYGSLKNKYSAGWAILISSLVFGAFHMSLVKLIPTAMLGACFAYIAYRSGSIYIGMFLHFLNNLLSMLSMQYPEQTEKLLPILTKTELTVLDNVCMILIGIAGVGIGTVLLRKKQ